MRLLDRLRMLLHTLFGRQAADADLHAELRFHLDQQIAENRAAGMSEREAHQAALRLFGNPRVVQERARETWSWQWLESVARDMRQGMRRVMRSPSFALTAIAVLALGIGANVALFTVVNAVLLKPLPVAHPNRLVRVYEANSRDHDQDLLVAGGSFARWQQQASSFAQMGIMQETTYNVAGGQAPEVVHAQQASWNTLPMLGVHPALGRLLNRDDDRPEANATVLLGWGLWKRRYGGDPKVVGHTILVDLKPYTVVGVLPAWFRYPDTRTQLWTPLNHERGRRIMSSVESHNFDGVGLLKPGVSIRQATAELSALQHQIRQQNPNGPVNDAVNLRPILDGQVRDVKAGLYALLAATGCLLLIACLNIANLLVARAASRGRETAIRTALGGTRVALIRAQVVESLLLSLAGGSMGLALAYGAVQWLVHTRADLPRVDTIHIDATTALFAAGCILLCGVVAGLVPALFSHNRNLVRALQESSRSSSAGRGRAGMRRMLLTAEVGLTVVLLIAAGLLLKSYRAMRSSNFGCATQNLLTMNISQARNARTQQQLVAFYDDLLQKVRALPGVLAAGASTRLPGQDRWEDVTYTIPEHPPLRQGQFLDAANRSVDPGYFQAMQIPLLAGRSFTNDERLQRGGKVIISQELARRKFKGENPIGKHIDSAVFTSKVESFEIIGVAADTRELPAADFYPTLYFPLLNGEENSIYLAIRTAGDPGAMGEPVKRALASIDSNLPVADVMTMDEIIGQAAMNTSFEATLLAALAILSLVLAAVGLFGVLSFLVTQRTAEIGMRIALGARRGEVLRLMLLDGLRPAVVGLVLGLAASAAVTRYMQSLLVNTRPLDPLVYAGVGLVLLTVAALACLLPAWSASRLDPMQALRTE
jgi:predicted permease